MLFALLTALVVTLAACGGGSSSTGGGGGGASGSTVAGTVNDGVASVYPAGQDQPVFLALADLLVEPAQAAPVEGVPVTLTCTPPAAEAPYNEQVTTGPDGGFLFENVPAGQCELQVYNDTVVLDVTGDSNTAAQVSGNGGTVVQVEVTVQVAPNTVSGEIEDDASSDDDSSGDGASEDDDSSDDASVDDDSVDDDSNDDGDSNDEGDSDPTA